jgi:hypothetical protein
VSLNYRSKNTNKTGTAYMSKRVSRPTDKLLNNDHSFIMRDEISTSVKMPSI